MEQVRKTICDCCRKSVPVSDIRYMPKGKDSRIILCPECRAKRVGTVEKEVPIPKKKAPPKIVAKSQSYLCLHCKYKFKSHHTYDIPECPYCGNSNRVIKTKELSADTLIKTSEEY